ncbi:MAG TPA: hypothetical protein DEF51_48700 [Myxococcales bacterium]|nr:hypothetical protein [Myxococcales bacterium]
MILDVPTASDFQNHGARFLNLAWDVVVRHAKSMDDFEHFGDTEDFEEDFWRAAVDDVGLALALAHTGVDHLLKAGIASVSPFLLISSTPREWPRGCDKDDIPFAEFRTVDSQDLVRTYNAVAPQRLPDAFLQQHDKLRRVRNRLIHTVDHRLTPAVKDLVLAVLVSTHYLAGSGSWIAMRRKGLEASPIATLFPDSGPLPTLNQELRHVVGWLGAKELKLYVGIDKKRRLYSCPRCLEECERDMQEHFEGVAQLTPGGPGARFLHCVACGEQSEVARQRCSSEGCKGNVRDPSGEVCLTCNC